MASSANKKTDRPTPSVAVPGALPPSPQRRQLNRPEEKTDTTLTGLPRRSSNPEPMLERAVRPNRRIHSFSPESTVSRYDDILVPPEALAELHKLHEYFLGRQSSDDDPDDTSEAALQGVWTEENWLAFGEVPQTKEKPLHVRNLVLCPRGRFETSQRWNGAALNTKGRKSPTDATIGQDNCSISRLVGGWECVCVMDGHGVNGDWPATRAVRTMPYFLQGLSCSKMLRQMQVDAALLHAFGKVQRDLVHHARVEQIDLQVCGCTAACVLWKPDGGAPNKVWVATCGDSRVVAIRSTDGTVLAQTVDHKPSVPAEKARVEKLGMEVVRTEYDDGWVEERCNIKGYEYPGICMTRSLGDLAVKAFGIVSDPEVVEWALPPDEDVHIFAASDGVWEFLESEVVASTLCNTNRLEGEEQACKKLLKQAREAWSNSEGAYCDDITMVFVATRSGKTERSLSLVRGNMSCFSGACGGCSMM